MATNAHDTLSSVPQTPTVNPVLVAQVAAASQTIEVDQDSILHLPEGTSIASPRANGTDLEFVQPDGTVIVVPNGAIIGLVIMIGATEIPADAVAAMFSANGIETAAGPAAPATPPSSGGDFINEIPSIGDPEALIDLLGYDDYDLPTPDLEDLEDGGTTGPGNRPPSFLDESGVDLESILLAAVSEEVSVQGESFVSTSTPNPDDDGSDDTSQSRFSSGVLSVVDPDLDALTFELDAPLEVLLSHGVQIVWTGMGTSELVGSANDVPVIILKVTDGAMAAGGGAYTVELRGPIDHPNDGGRTDPNQPDEDDVSLHIGVTVRDGNGGSDTATLVLPIEDDSPEPLLVQGQWSGQPFSLVLDETVRSDGSFTPPYDRPTTGLTTNGGYDDVDTNNLVFNREPVFSNNPAANAAFGHSAVSGATLASLYSETPNYGADGAGIADKVGYSLGLSAADITTTLVATRLTNSPISSWDETARTIHLMQSGGDIVGQISNGVSTYVVFRMSVSAAPELGIDQFLPIAHNDTGSLDEAAYLTLLGGGTLTLTETYTATDYDGDAKTVTQSIVLAGADAKSALVSFEDDGPATMFETRNGAFIVVDEDGLHGAPALSTSNLDDAEIDGETDGNESATATGLSGALSALVDFGRDGFGSFGLVTTSAPVDTGFESKGGAIFVVSDGTTLHGYVDPGLGTQREIFTLTVDADGAYIFTLKDQIDHPEPESGAYENYLAGQGLDLSGFITATDGDGDSISLDAGAFTVQVLDDIPVISAKPAETTTGSIDFTDSDISGGNETYVVLDGPGDADLLFSARQDGAPIKVNTSGNDIGAGTGQNINGKDNNDEEYVRIDLVTHGVTDGDSYSASSHFHTTSFGFKVVQTQAHAAASVFIQIFDVPDSADNTSGSNLDDDARVDVVSIKVGTTSNYPMTVVMDGVTIRGYLIEGVPEGSIVTVTGASAFSRVVVSNYDGVTVNGDEISGAKSFGIAPDSAGTTTAVDFIVRHDETTGSNPAADPNAADDTAASAPTIIDGAFGYAKSSISVLSLFDASVGADEPAGYSFRIVDANGEAIDDLDSGLFTLAGDEISVSTVDSQSGSVLEGTANGETVFKIYIDETGAVWIAQYLPIRHDEAGSSGSAFDEIALLAGDLRVEATITDFDGDSAVAVSNTALRIEFQDGGPVANNDADSVTEDGPTTADGNVVTGLGGSDTNITDGAADVMGADGFKSISWANAVNGTITGLYGTLTVGTDGSYSYQLNSNLAVVQGLGVGEALTNEVFAYTVTDGDGDTATATLRITINGSDDIVTISGLDGEGAEETVDEDDLQPGGSDQTGSVTQTGTFFFSAPDGVASLVIGGKTVVTNDVVSPTYNVPFATSYGMLTITSVSLVTGTVAYSYTLAANTTDHIIAGEDAVSDDITVTVTDPDGSIDSATLNIQVVDDVPTAEDDDADQTDENQPVTIDVLANDAKGADGVAFADVVLVGNHTGLGLLDYNNDGTFTYTPASGEQGDVSFDYQITDADGDVSTATATIHLADDSEPSVMVDDGIVDEKGLTGGSDEPGGAETTTGSFTISIGGDALDKLEVKDKNGDWIDVTNGGTVDGANGLLTVTLNLGVYSWSYTLGNPLTHPDDANTGTADQLPGDSFAVRVEDSDGDVSPLDTLTIKVNDDGPGAADDGASTTEGGAAIIAAALTGVLSNDTLGADRPGTVIAVSGGSIGTEFQGTYGKLTLDADGSYTYTPNVSAPNGAQDSFTYTLQDADGDTSQAVLRFTFSGDANHASAGATTALVDEDDLAVIGNHDAANGDNVPSVQPDTLPHTYGADGDGYITFVDGSEIVNGVTYTYTASNGGTLLTANDGVTDVFTVTLTDNVAGTYTVALLAPISHLGSTPGFEDNLDFALSYEVFDADDATGAAGTLTLTIDDDIPVAIDHGVLASVVEGSASNVVGTLADLLVGANYGADGAHASTPIVIGSGTRGGTVTVDSGNNLIYTPAGNVGPAGAEESFSYTVKDGDGDTVTKTFKLAITDTGVTLGAAPANLLVDEDDIASVAGNPGGSGDAASPVTSGIIAYSLGADAIGSVSLSTAGNATGLLTLDGTSVVTSFVSGQLIGYRSTGSAATPADRVFVITLGTPGATQTTYSIALLQPVRHSVAGTEDDTTPFTVNVTVSDADGSTAQTSFTVAIDDDTPVGRDDARSVIEGGIITGNVLTDGTADTFGADGATTTSPVGGVVGVRHDSDTSTPASGNLGGVGIAGSYGTLILNANGSYSYDGSPGVVPPIGATEVFVYTIRDADGDLSTAKLTITLTDSGITAPDDGDITVYENALDTGVTGLDLASGTITGSLGAGSANETDSTGNLLNATSSAGGITYALQTGGNVATAGTYGTIRVNSDGTYIYTLTAPFSTNPATDNQVTTEVAESFTYVATDANGNTATGIIRVNIVDDVPTAVAGPALSVVETDGALAGTGLLNNDVRGADGASVTHVDLGGGFVAIASGTSIGGGSYTFNRPGVGLYTFNADGSWSIDPVVNASLSSVDGSFSYRITDGDGDTSTATQSVTITNANNVPSGNAITGAVDDEGLPHGIAGGTGDDTSTALSYKTGTLTGSGGDGALNFGFANLIGGTGTVGQESVSYAWDATFNRLTATITASPNSGRTGTALFVVDVVPATGAYVFNLLRPVVHASGSDENDASVQLQYRVGDSDADTSVGDTGLGTLTISLDDDAPVAFTAQSMSIENGANAIGTGALNFYESIGADGGSVVFTGTNGSNLKSGVTDVTSGGKVVHLYGFGTDTLTGKIDLDGNSANGDEATVFTVKLSPNAASEPLDTYTVQFFRALDDGSQITLNPGSLGITSSAGNAPFAMIDGASDHDLLISASQRTGTSTLAASTVNANSSTVGVGSGQSVGNNDLLRFDFVDTSVLNKSGSAFTYNYASHFAVNQFSFDVQSTSGTVEIWLRAYNAANNDPAGTDATAETAHLNALLPGASGTTQATITGILVNGLPITLATLQSADGGKSYLLTGLNAGDVVKVVASGGMSRVEVENPSSTNTAFTGGAALDNDSFKVGAFGWATYSGGVGAPLNLSFNVTATDADGDTAAGTLSVNTKPPQPVLDGTAGSDLLVAGNAGETLNGLGGDDTLIGGIGADTLNGGLHGTAGDTASYQDSVLGVQVNLNTLTAQASTGDASGDTLSGIENVTGSNAGDTLTGDAAANTLIGLGGDDTLNGGGGNDTLIGGLGIDILSGGANDDILYGGAGNDNLTGGTGADTFAFAESGAANVDTITDFVIGVGGDKLDLSAILDVAFGPASTVSDFLRVVDSGTTATVQVDVNGTHNFTSAGDVAVLNNINGGDVIKIFFEGVEHDVTVT